MQCYKLPDCLQTDGIHLRFYLLAESRRKYFANPLFTPIFSARHRSTVAVFGSICRLRVFQFLAWRREGSILGTISQATLSRPCILHGLVSGTPSELDRHGIENSKSPS